MKNKLLIFCWALSLLLTAVAAAQTHTLPAARTVTSAGGRKLEGTILSKTETSIKFRRTSDGKEFDLPLDKLSAEDKAFVAGAKEKKTTVLLVDHEAWKIAPVLKDAGFEVTIVPEEMVERDTVTDKQEPITVKEPISTIGKMTDDEIKKFDILWIHSFDGIHNVKDRLINLIPQCKVVVWKRYFKISRNKFLKERELSPPSMANYDLFVNPEGNLILYNDRGCLRTGTERKIWPDIQQKLIANAKELARASN